MLEASWCKGGQLLIDSVYVYHGDTGNHILALQVIFKGGGGA